VVVSNQSAATLEECLQRLRQAADICQIRVIDNDSDDGSQEIIQRQALADPRLRFIINPNNPGFAAACNQGAQASNAPWLAFIHPEVMVKADTLAKLRELGQSLGDCVLGVEQVDEYGVLDSTIRCTDPDFRALLRHPFSPTWRVVAPDLSRTLQPVPALSGALLLMPRRLFERLNGWDDGYRLPIANLDLCRRAREAGAVVAIATTLNVVHLRDVSSQLHPFFTQWHEYWGLWRYFCKFHACQYTLPLRITIACVMSVRAVISLAWALLTGFR